MIKSTHIIYDFQYDGELIDVSTVMDTAISNVGDLTIVDKFQHHFNPYGLSIVYILAESHISIHTWEEYNYISIDMYTCGDISPENTLKEFLSNFTIIAKKKTDNRKRDIKLLKLKILPVSDINKLQKFASPYFNKQLSSYDLIFKDRLIKQIQNREIITVYDNEEIIAFIQYHKYRNGTYKLQNILVHENYRNKGIATKLLKYIKTPCELEVASNNPAIYILRMVLNQ